jgi:adenine-specific DNA-methyltransferase
MTRPLFAYMGTKRYLTSEVITEISSVSKVGTVVDLFAGSGAVSSGLVEAGRTVIANDAAAFICGLQRAQLLKVYDMAACSLEDIVSAARVFESALTSCHEKRIAEELAALDGNYFDLHRIMTSAPSPLDSDFLTAKSSRRCQAVGGSYGLVLDYFGSRYFSSAQAVGLDSLRQAIDILLPDSEYGEAQSIWTFASQRDIALSAWLLAAHSVANTPGHGAQYLKATSRGVSRVRSNWRKSVLDAFVKQYKFVLERNSTYSRENNKVMNCDALTVFDRPDLDISAAYADPPYTKDQYSRMYHLHETLYLYDAPAVAGVGLARQGRFVSAFGRKSTALSSIKLLVSAAKRSNCPLVLSYPAQGLIALPRDSWESYLNDWHTLDHVRELSVEYSTLGGRSGSSKKAATERIYVMR